MHRKIIPIVSVALFAGAILIWFFARQPASRLRHRTTTVDEKASAVTDAATRSVNSAVTQPPAEPGVAASASPPQQHELVQTNANFHSEAEARTKEVEPFQLRGRGTSNAAIVDSRGNVVIQADPKIGIYGCEVSPNGKRIVVYYGSAEYEIIDPSIGFKTTLPKQPQGENKLGFASWHWIDNDLLLGESGDELGGRKPGAKGEGSNVVQTRLYLFDVNRQGLEEVQLPKDLGAKIFSVTEVSPDGAAHLIHDDPGATRPPDLGWFKIRGK